jgi:flagellar biosynthetic protein FliS
MKSTDFAYRTVAVQGASGFGLLIAFYDTLAGDLRRAAAAQREGRIESRTNELKHALLVVSYMENSVDPESGELARKLIDFYARTRKRIVEAQARQSAKLLDEIMAEVLSLREVWQKLDLRREDAGPEILPPARPASYGGIAAGLERRQLSWSA